MAPPRKYSTLEEKRKAKAERERKRRATMAPEKREVVLRKSRERGRKMRQNWTEEELETHRRKCSQAKKKRLSTFTQEEREEYLWKQHEEYLKKKEIRRKREENEEDGEVQLWRERRRNSSYMCRHAKLASMTKEEREEYDRKNREKCRETRKNLTEEEKKQRYCKQYFRIQAKLAQMTPQEKEEFTRKNTKAAKRWRENLTGEKRERYKESLRNYQKQYPRKPKSAEQHERILEYHRKRTANETPEERRKRLRRYKVNQAVRKLRKELENEGISQEEIEEKARELKTSMWAEPLPPPPPQIGSRSRRKSSQSVTGEEMNDGREPKTRIIRQKPTLAPPPPSTFHHSLIEEKVNVVSGESSTLTTAHESGDVDMETCDNFSGISHDDYGDIDFDREVREEEHSTALYSLTSMAPISIPIDQIIQLPSTAFECPHCTSSFSQREDLISHISSEHPKKCWTCPVCAQLILTSSELKEHFKSQHAPKIPIKIPSSEVESKRVASFNCIKCDVDSEKELESLKKLNEHVKSKHPESYWPCSKCNILRYSDKSLRLHERVCGSASLINKKVRH